MGLDRRDIAELASVESNIVFLRKFLQLIKDCFVSLLYVSNEFRFYLCEFSPKYVTTFLVFRKSLVRPRIIINGLKFFDCLFAFLVSNELEVSLFARANA